MCWSVREPWHRLPKGAVISLFGDSQSKLDVGWALLGVALLRQGGPRGPRGPSDLSHSMMQLHQVPKPTVKNVNTNHLRYSTHSSVVKRKYISFHQKEHVLYSCHKMDGDFCCASCRSALQHSLHPQVTDQSMGRFLILCMKS